MSIEVLVSTYVSPSRNCIKVLAEHIEFIEYFFEIIEFSVCSALSVSPAYSRSLTIVLYFTILCCCPVEPVVPVKLPHATRFIVIFLEVSVSSTFMSIEVLIIASITSLRTCIKSAL